MTASAHGLPGRQRGRRLISLGGGCLLAALAGLVVFDPPRAGGQNPGTKPARSQADAPTALKELLPTPPSIAPATSPWNVQALTEVPHVELEKPAPAKRPEKPGRRPNLRTLDSYGARLLATTVVAIAESGAQETTERQRRAVADRIAKVNQLNQKGTDRFLKVLMENRPDLAGLPVTMGDACRTKQPHSGAFAHEVRLVRDSLPPPTEVVVLNLLLSPVLSSLQDGGPSLPSADRAQEFWKKYDAACKARTEQADIPMRVAALTQILAVESAEVRRGLVDYLGTIEHREATRALARLAVFSIEPEVRRRAVAALKDRPAPEYNDLLLAGLNYPWPAVAAQAGEAVIELRREELVPQLVTLLDEPDPRAPAPREVDGKKVPAVRELVRLNHHRNCLLCHAPANQAEVNAFGRSDSSGVLTAPVPVPSEPLPSESNGYGAFAPPDTFVRIDVTYLRQDFSLLQPVDHASPWPRMQRFDFLVRTRPATEQEVADYPKWQAAQGADHVPPNRQAALRALRALTGRDAAEPTATAWRRLLGV